MKSRTFRLIVTLAFVAALTIPAFLSAQRPTATAMQRQRRSSPLPSSLPRRSGEARLPATASPDIIWVQCPPEAQALGATCGKLPQPLDRRHLNGPTIGIYFELYLHTSSGPAVSAILANTGGPGLSTTESFFRATALAQFSQNLDVHDVLLIDDRGRGLSAAINCEELQHGTVPFWVAEADCAAQLGAADSRYGTGDIAMDSDCIWGDFALKPLRTQSLWRQRSSLTLPINAKTEKENTDEDNR